MPKRRGRPPKNRPPIEATPGKENTEQLRRNLMGRIEKTPTIQFTKQIVVQNEATGTVELYKKKVEIYLNTFINIICHFSVFLQYSSIIPQNQFVPYSWRSHPKYQKLRILISKGQ